MTDYYGDKFLCVPVKDIDWQKYGLTMSMTTRLTGSTFAIDDNNQQQDLWQALSKPKKAYSLISNVGKTIITRVKDALTQMSSETGNPYSLAMQNTLEEFEPFLFDTSRQGQASARAIFGFYQNGKPHSDATNDDAPALGAGFAAKDFNQVQWYQPKKAAFQITPALGALIDDKLMPRSEIFFTNRLNYLLAKGSMREAICDMPIAIKLEGNNILVLSHSIIKQIPSNDLKLSLSRTYAPFATRAQERAMEQIKSEQAVIDRRMEALNDVRNRYGLPPRP